MGQKEKLENKDYIKEIEKLAKELESEKNFEKSIEQFSRASELIKIALSSSEQERGKIYQIIRELDEIIEEEMED